MRNRFLFSFFAIGTVAYLVTHLFSANTEVVSKAIQSRQPAYSKVTKVDSKDNEVDEHAVTAVAPNIVEKPKLVKNALPVQNPEQRKTFSNKPKSLNQFKSLLKRELALEDKQIFKLMAMKAKMGKELGDAMKDAGKEGLDSDEVETQFNNITAKYNAQLAQYLGEDGRQIYQRIEEEVFPEEY